MRWIELHTQSEKFALDAEIAHRHGEQDKAKELYAQAADLEAKATAQIEPNKSRTYGITAVSAVSLWYKEAAEKVA